MKNENLRFTIDDLKIRMKNEEYRMKIYGLRLTIYEFSSLRASYFLTRANGY